VQAAATIREFEFTDADFGKVRELARRSIGISLAASKRELVYGRLARRLRHLGLSSFAEYLGRLEDSGGAELEQFCNALTTNLTAFFRERHHFDFLARAVLPVLQQRNARTRRIRIWSAGCATGEEAYSIAMVVRETLGGPPDWDLRILATDVDSSVLARATSGIYDSERLESVEPVRRERWFRPVAGGRRLAVQPELRALIAFRQLNLVGTWPMRGTFDVIFCRNVIIYFDKATQRHVISRMAGLQRAGDHLVLGHSESLLGVADCYEAAGRTIYTRLG